MAWEEQAVTPYSSAGYPSKLRSRQISRFEVGGHSLAPFSTWAQLPKMRRPLLSLSFWVLPLAYVPAWWRKGWPRGRADSMAEAELLSELAALLMPRTEVGVLFRSFPATEGWGGHSLQPDLAAYGVLKDRNAALFLEYDGFWRHGEREGIAMDQRKNAALLAYAPEGSFVIRIAHKVGNPILQGHTLWIQVDAWRQADECSLAKSLQHVLSEIVSGLREVLHPRVIKQFQKQLASDQWMFSDKGRRFVTKTALRTGKNSSEEISSYFAHQGFSQMETELMQSGIKSNSQSIDRNLEPKFVWLTALGLSKMQVAKAVAAFPQILGCSVQQNLKPTVEWLKESWDLARCKLQRQWQILHKFLALAQSKT